MESIKIDGSKNHQIGEPEVIKRILSGEKQLYEILIRRNNQKLYRAIRSYINEITEIEDIMQNTYLKAYEKLYQFKHNSTFSTWLIKIAINETLGRLKEKGKVYQLYDRDTTFEHNTIQQMQDPNQLNPENQVIRREAKQLLENTIDTLDIKYRTVYILKEVEGMKINEISDCLNLSVPNVKVRLHRAKILLKEKLYELSINNDIHEFGSSRCDRLTTYIMKCIQ